jgi:hypothetical protein
MRSLSKGMGLSTMRRLCGLSAALATINVIATIAVLSASESSSSREVRLWIGGDVNLGTRNNPVLKSLEDMLKGAVRIVNLEGPAAQ